MKPRIFVSSTFYDLKYVREDISAFIRKYDFEPIMFEDGDIGYTPGHPLDTSCYETMRSADMVVLIVGGNYGSPAEGEKKDEFKEYMSVTRNEFKRAIDEGVPVYAFIDSKVYVEYGIYEENVEDIEKGKIKISFRNTKDINVFRFIKEIKKIGNIPMTEFSKIIQIKDFLSKQWSDMFKKYLSYLRNDKKDKEIKDSVDNMNLLVQKMDLMLDSMGKKILTEKDEDEYDKVILSQRLMEICNKISSGFHIRKKYGGEKDEFIEKFLEAIKEALDTNILEKLYSSDINETKKVIAFFAEKEFDVSMIKQGFEEYAKEFVDLYDNHKEALIKELGKDIYTNQMLR